MRDCDTLLPWLCSKTVSQWPLISRCITMVTKRARCGKLSSSSESDGALSAAVVIQKSTPTISIRCKAWCTMHTISWQFFHVICPRCRWTTFPTLSFYSTLKYLLFNTAVSSDNMTKISVLSLHDPRSEVQICSNLSSIQVLVLLSFHVVCKRRL